MLSLGAVAAGARGVGNGGFGHVLLMCGMCVVGARLGRLRRALIEQLCVCVGGGGAHALSDWRLESAT